MRRNPLSIPPFVKVVVAAAVVVGRYTVHAVEVVKLEPVFRRRSDASLDKGGRRWADVSALGTTTVPVAQYRAAPKSLSSVLLVARFLRGSCLTPQEASSFTHPREKKTAAE